MVINNSFRFVFVHVPKAAGTSMRSALKRLDGDETSAIAPRTKHETLYQVRAAWPDRVGAASDALDDYFVFGFVRNPWERMVSLYHYLVERRPRKEIDGVDSFAHFLRLVGEEEPWVVGLHSMRVQVDFFRPQSDSQPHADFVGHLEHLHEDFDWLCQRLELPDSLVLEQLNRSSNSDRDYREFYTPALVDIVAGRFANDVETFGYSFEQRAPARRCSGPCGGSIAKRSAVGGA